MIKKGAAMRHYLTAAFILAALAFAPLPSSASEGGGLVSSTGNLLWGTLYKQSGMEREGYITIRTSWAPPTSAPVYRYDFDVIHGRIEDNLYSFLMGDIAEMEFLPIENGGQPVNITLRNGVIQKAVLSSEDKAVLGQVNLMLKEADVLTDKYGENVVTGGEVYKIVFAKPDTVKDEDMQALVDALGLALDTAGRDSLVDKDFLTVLQNIQKKMKAKRGYETKDKKINQ
jgi:hypothetical protein